MRHIFLLLTCLIIGGCVSAKLGETYNPGVHENTPEGRATLIVFVDKEVEAGIVYRVWVNDKELGYVFPNTFAQTAVSPGEVKIRFWEQVEKVDFEPPPESLTLLGSPFSFKPGPEHSINTLPGEVHYMSIRKKAEEYFEQCAESKETTTICSRYTYTTVIEQVDADVATAALQGMRESL